MSDFLVTPWTVGRQAPLSMGYSKEEFEAGLPFPPPGDLPDPETESASPAAPISQADPFLLSHQGSPISGLREVRSSLQSIATSPEKGGIWLVPARHCGRWLYSYYHMPPVLPDRACQTPFTVKEPEALSESLMM